MTSLHTVLDPSSVDPALLAAASAADPDPLKAATALRRAFPHLAPDAISAALTQARLRQRARSRLGPDADLVLLTEAGLEQATRTPVATIRATRLAQGAHIVADLGCGIGTDSWAMARAGLKVIALEKDEQVAAIAAHNAQTLGLDVEVLVGDITDSTTLSGILARVDAVFIDPARRSGTSRLMSPHQWSPPWSFVQELAQRIPVVAKVAPGMDMELIRNSEIVFTSHDGDLVEATVWFTPLGQAGRRSAVVMRGTHTMTLSTNAARSSLPISEPKAFILDPDDGFIRADVLHMLDVPQAHLLDEHVAWLTTDIAPDAGRMWLGTWYRVLRALPFNMKEIRWALAELGISNVTIMKRAFAGDVEEMRKQLKLSGNGRDAVLMLTRTDAGPIAVISEQVFQ